MPHGGENVKEKGGLLHGRWKNGDANTMAKATNSEKVARIVA